jgi:hypothetical protein
MMRFTTSSNTISTRTCHPSSWLIDSVCSDSSQTLLPFQLEQQQKPSNHVSQDQHTSQDARARSSKCAEYVTLFDIAGPGDGEDPVDGRVNEKLGLVVTVIVKKDYAELLEDSYAQIFLYPTGESPKNTAIEDQPQARVRAQGVPITDGPGCHQYQYTFRSLKIKEKGLWQYYIKVKTYDGQDIIAEGATVEIDIASTGLEDGNFDFTRPASP